MDKDINAHFVSCDTHMLNCSDNSLTESINLKISDTSAYQLVRNEEFIYLNLGVNFRGFF